MESTTPVSTQPRLHLLGPFGLTVPNKGFLPLHPRRKPEGLLAYLGTFSESLHSRDVLINHFWVDSMEKSGRSSLRTGLYRLRELLNESGIDSDLVIIEEKGRIGIDIENIFIDIACYKNFKRAAVRSVDKEQKLLHLESAICSYTGNLLVDSSYDWIYSERDHLSADFLETIGMAASVSKDLGLTQKLESFLRLAISFSPTHEEYHEELIKVYIENGDYVQAKRQYGELKEILEHHFQCSPSPNIQSILTDRKRGNTYLPSLNPGKNKITQSLPADRYLIFGREEEIVSLCGLLSNQTASWITLIGTGGCGKTRLATEIATQIQAENAVTTVWVNLGDVGTAQRAIEKINFQIDLQQSVGQNAYYIFLDNMEQLSQNDINNISNYISEKNKEAIVIATSRRRLNIKNEQCIVVKPLLCPKINAKYSEITLCPSVQMFLFCAKRAESDFTITPQNADAIAQICRLLDGLPLAIEMAAVRVPVLSPNQILANLTKKHSTLAHRLNDIPERHRSLDVMIRWSYELLSPSAQRLLRALTVFRGGWDLTAVEQVMGESNIEELLMELYDHSLLQTSTLADGEKSFSILETVRQFAQSYLTPDEERELNVRHSEYYLQKIQEIVRMQDYNPDIESIYDNIFSILEKGCEDIWYNCISLRVIPHMQGYVVKKQNVSHAFSIFKKIIDYSMRNNMDSLDFLKSVMTVATLCVPMREFELGNTLKEVLIEKSKSVNDIHYQINLSGFLCFFELESGNLINSEKHCKNAIYISESNNIFSPRYAMDLILYGAILSRQNKITEAISVYKKCIGFCSDKGSEYKHPLGAAYCDITRLYAIMNDYENAKMSILHSKDAFASLKDQYGLLRASVAEIDVSIESKDLTQAVSLLHEYGPCCWETKTIEVLFMCFDQAFRIAEAKHDRRRQLLLRGIAENVAAITKYPLAALEGSRLLNFSLEDDPFSDYYRGKAMLVDTAISQAFPPG